MIIRKSEDEIKKIQQAGRIVGGAFNLIREKIEPGISGEELNKAAEKYIIKQGGKPAFKGYRGFPASICVSVNEGVVHGIPDSTRLKQGDIVSIDIGVELEGYFADAAETIPVGDISNEAQRLIDVTRASLQSGISQCINRKRLFDISYAIQQEAEGAGFSVVRDFVGHGIGRKMHEEPQVPNYGEKGRGIALQEGMVFALEPMINLGGHKVQVLEDNWGVVSVDMSLSAHFEHTVAVTKGEPLVLTLS